MTALDSVQRALVIAPHPDDEVLGCGGTIARLVSMGCQVEILVVTRGMAPLFDEDQANQVRDEARQAHWLLGVTQTQFLDFPAAGLDGVSRAALNAAVAKSVMTSRPDMLLVPFVGDLHFDHKLVFDAAMVAARPLGPDYPRRILAYETVSETNWSAPYLGPAFQPNVFIDISSHLDQKLDAFACFRSQVRPFPNERSLETLRALAMVRGSCVSCAAAEAFTLIREVA